MKHNYTLRTVQLKTSQAGASLVVILILTIIMSLMVAWGVKMVTFQTRITANQAFKDQAFIRADNAIVAMENCITGATLPSTTECRNGSVNINANTLFDGTVPGFLQPTSTISNFNRSSMHYWTPGFSASTTASHGNTALHHNWNDQGLYTTVAVAGQTNAQTARLAVERQNNVTMAGFSSDTASQGFDLGAAVPFRITANTANTNAVGANAVLQSVVYVPAAMVTTQ